MGKIIYISQCHWEDSKSESHAKCCHDARVHRVKWNIWWHFALMMHPKGICKYWHTIWWSNYRMPVVFCSSKLASNVHESQSVPLSAFFQTCVLLTCGWYADFMLCYGYVTEWFEPINASLWAIYRSVCSEARARVLLLINRVPGALESLKGSEHYDNLSATFCTTHIAHTRSVDIMLLFSPSNWFDSMNFSSWGNTSCLAAVFTLVIELKKVAHPQMGKFYDTMQFCGHFAHFLFSLEILKKKTNIWIIL